MVWTHIGNGLYLCDSADTKVTVGITTGAQLFEINSTSLVEKAYRFNGTAWAELTLGSGGGTGDVTGAANVGTGTGTVFRDEVTGVLNLKTIKAGTNITITNNVDDVTISGAAGTGEANTASNAGVGGIGITLPKSGVDLPFKSIIAASTKITVADGGANNNVTIDVNQTNLSIAWSQLTSIPISSETTAGIVELGTSAETVAGLAVQTNDTRLTNARTPLAHNHAAGDINSGTLAVAQGGLNKSTIAQHALLKGGATNTYAEIPVGTENHVLSVVSGTPAWKSLDSERTGKAVASGTGSATTFTIAHGLGVVPGYAFVDCSSHAIGRTWTVDATNITIVFASAPPSGTNNVIIYWRVIAS